MVATVWAGLKALVDAVLQAHIIVGKMDDDERVQVIATSPARFTPMAGQKFHSAALPTVPSSIRVGLLTLVGQPFKRTR